MNCPHLIDGVCDKISYTTLRPSGRLCDRCGMGVNLEVAHEAAILTLPERAPCVHRGDVVRHTAKCRSCSSAVFVCEHPSGPAEATGAVCKACPLYNEDAAVTTTADLSAVMRVSTGYALRQRGFGDTVAAVAKWCRIPHCEPCSRRQAWLNRSLPYTPPVTSRIAFAAAACAVWTLSALI